MKARLMHKTIAFLLVAVIQALPRIHLRRSATGEQRFVDDVGRETFFHGTNAVVKGPPWIPSRKDFDPLTSLTAKDFQLMRAAGLNILRLGVMWPGVEPHRGVYNESYLSIVREIVEEAATYGIYILADMHQDLLSEKFCGEGVPLWAAQPLPVPFPVPLSLPFVPGWDGLPKREDCLRFESWAAYQSSIATVSAYDRLFTNHDNLTDAWGAFWAKVAQTLVNAPVLGMNIINEPFPGNFYEDPSLLLPHVADRKRLQPAYDTVAEHIRAVAPEALIFFAGTTWDRTGRITDRLPLGFEHPPGGKEFANRSVNSFHYYTPPQSADHAKNYLQQRLHDAQRLGTGLFLTETCCDFFFEEAALAADRLGLSWLHWEWKPFCKNSTSKSESQAGDFGACKTGSGGWPFSEGVFIESMYRALARPYAQAIAGNFSFASFHAESAYFRLEFFLDPKIQQPTVVSTPDIVYPAGFTLAISPNAFDVEYLTGLVHLRSKNEVAFGEKVILQVFPKGREVVV